MTKYYVIEKRYDLISGGDDTVGIYTAPVYGNMSHEPVINSWGGTINGVAVYAHGEYDTIEEAEQYIRDNFETRADIEFDPEFDDGVARYLVGKYAQLDGDLADEYFYDDVVAHITAATTDEEIERLDAERDEVLRSEIDPFSAGEPYAYTSRGEYARIARKYRAELQADE